MQSCLKNMSEGDQGLYLLKELNDTLYGILAHHCSYDVLDTEKVTWQSPSDLIEKVTDKPPASYYVLYISFVLSIHTPFLTCYIYFRVGL